MNKKFSTLLAGVALLGAMSANAGNPVTSLQKTGNGLYQIESCWWSVSDDSGRCFEIGSNY